MTGPQFGIENEKIRQFEHECLIRLFQWSFLPPGKALDFSVCDEAFGCYKTQYRKRHLLEICQNASFLSTPDSSSQASYRLRRVFFIKTCHSLILLLLASKCDPFRWARIWQKADILLRSVDPFITRCKRHMACSGFYAPKIRDRMTAV